ncbi:MAG TPA: NAD(P)/FAD-dependent oxidoreductase [Solirubrobacterales bacterium]
MGETELTPQHHVVVIGAGPAGIASALALKDAGLSAVVLDRADEVASSWRGRYEGLRLNTWRRFSQLPGRPYPKGTPTFPSRDEVIDYLARHAGEEGMDIRLGTRVERIEADGSDWVIRTSTGELRAPQVIVATGLEGAPVIPEWAGRDTFAGELIHSGGYRSPGRYRGKRVLMVGPGCSGMEIANELANGDAAKVWLAVRTPPNIMLRQGPGPVPGDLIATWLWHLPTGLADRIARVAARLDVGDLTEYGLERPETGVFAGVRERGKVPAIVDGEVIDSIKEGRIEVVAAVSSLAPGWVELDDGSRVEPDAVICATGYERGLEPLVGHLGVLGERGVPRALAPRPAAPGLRFVGYVPRPGGIGYMGKEARRSASAIARELREPRSRKEDESWQPRSAA